MFHYISEKYLIYCNHYFSVKLTLNQFHENVDNFRSTNVLLQIYQNTDLSKFWYFHSGIAVKFYIGPNFLQTNRNLCFYLRAYPLLLHRIIVL